MTDPASQESAAESNTPGGDGPVRLGDRTDGGSPASNQAQGAPPVSDARLSAPGGQEPAVVPVDDLNVTASDPQAPAHGSASTRPFTEAPSGPAPQAQGYAQRATGSQGVAEEPIETDKVAGAAAMAPPAFFSDAPGDSQGVPVPSDEASEGTSETLPIVQGVRTPVE